MRIEFVRVYQQFGPGKILDIGDGHAEVLIRRGIAKPAPVAEIPAATPPEQPPAAPPPPAPKPAKKGK
jgi:hypothetical protein